MASKWTQDLHFRSRTLASKDVPSTSRLMTLPLEIRDLIWEFAMPEEIVYCSSTIVHRVSVKWYTLKKHAPLSLRNPLVPLLLINRQARDEVLRLNLKSPSLTFCDWKCARDSLRKRPLLLASLENYQVCIKGVLTVPDSYRNTKCPATGNPRRQAYEAMVEDPVAFKQFVIDSVFEFLRNDKVLVEGQLELTAPGAELDLLRLERETSAENTDEQYTMTLVGVAKQANIGLPEYWTA